MRSGARKILPPRSVIRWCAACVIAAAVPSCLDPASEALPTRHDAGGPPASNSTDAVIRTLYESRSATAIARAAAAAADARPPGAVDALVSTIREGRIGRGEKGEPDAIRAVGDALRRLADSRAADLLVAILRGDGNAPDPHVLMLVTRILPAIGDTRTVALITPLLGQNIAADRKAAAASVLVASGSEHGVSTVADAFTKAEDIALVRGYAAALAGAKSTIAVDALLARWDLAAEDAEKIVVLNALGECSDERAGPVALVALREEKSADVRRRAAAVVLRVGNADAWETLRGALSDPDPSVRMTVVGGLYWGPVVRAHRREVVAATVRALSQDPDATVRSSAARALHYHRESAPSACVAALMNALSDADASVRAAAAESLGIGEQMIRDRGDAPVITAALTRLSQDSSREVRDAAMASRGTFNPPAHAPATNASKRRLLVDDAGILLGDSP